MSSGGCSDGEDDNWDDNGWDSPKHGRVFAVPGPDNIGWDSPERGRVFAVPSHDQAPLNPNALEDVAPDPDFGGEWRPEAAPHLELVPPDVFAPELAGAGQSARVRSRGTSSDAAPRYPRPRPPRRDDFINFGLNKRMSGIQNKIFVSNLPYHYYESDLDGIFSRFGRIKSCQVVRERFARYPNRRGDFRSKGFGFVEFADAEGWTAALNASEEELTFEGRIVKVSKAREDRKARNDAVDLATGHGVDRVNPVDAAEAGSVDEAPFGSDGVDLSFSEAFAAATLTASDASTPSTPLPSAIHHPIPSNDLDSESFADQTVDLSFANLPDAVVVKIFGFLNLREKAEVELVSKRWRRLALSSWSSLTEFIVPKYRGLYAFGSGLTDQKFMR